ncbi:MAG TPA: hypothetical protein VFI31_12055 [Pirellulales bacterium]|nr:hypothetical protein [Pirellulales bacterium]
MAWDWRALSLEKAAIAIAPGHIAPSIVFLASPVAGFIYGATLDVNGGRGLR